MPEHPNATMYRNGFAAFSAGDVAGMGDMLAEDVVWNLAVDEPPVTGRAAVVDAISGDIAGVEVSVDLHDVLASDEHLVALLDVAASRGEDAINYRSVEVMHVAHGKVTERWSMVDDPGAVAAFFAG